MSCNAVTHLSSCTGDSYAGLKDNLNIVIVCSALIEQEKVYFLQCFYCFLFAYCAMEKWN